MGRTDKRFKFTGILIAAASLAFLAGTAGFGMAFQDENDQMAQPPPARRADDLGQDRSGRGDANRGRRFGEGGRHFGRASGRRFPVGTYDLKIEVKAATDSEPVQVLVNGKRVAVSEAAFLMRFIMKRQGASPGQAVDPMGPALTVERIDDVMTVVKDFDAFLYADLLRMQQNDTPRFAVQIRRSAFEFAREIDLKERDEEAYQLKVDDRLLETQLRELQFEIGMTGPTEASVIAEYQDQMRVILEGRFEIQHQLRGRDLERMKTRLEWVEMEWTKRLERMDEIVDGQLSNIFDELLINGR